VDVPGSRGANEHSGSGERQARGDRGPRRVRDVEVEDGEQESERNANAARYAGPSGWWRRNGISRGVSHATPEARGLRRRPRQVEWPEVLRQARSGGDDWSRCPENEG